MDRIGVIIVLLILLVIFIGTIVLQIFLSTRKSKGVGLILPAVTFAFSIILLAGVTLYVAPAPTGVDVLMLIIGFMVPTNIPTIILLVIYAICRLVRKDRNDNENNNKILLSNQIDKMNIQDLG